MRLPLVNPTVHACILLVAAAVRGAAGWKICNVMSYGAVGDGIHADTIALRAAIASCHGGGEVVVPPGRYLTAPFNLSSNLALRLDPRAVLLGTNYTMYPLPPLPSMGGSVAAGGGGGAGLPCRYSPLVGAGNATNVTIFGGGRIDGQGPLGWYNYKPRACRKPMLVEFWYVTGLRLHNITLHNSPFWTLHPYFSKDIHISNINITVDPPGNGHFNTDGIDPDSCENVLIEDYYYCGGDDAIAIKSGWNIAGVIYGKPSRNITVRRSSSGCRGGWTIGSEAHAGVYDVLFEDLVSNSESGIRISAELGRGGTVQNVTFRRLTFNWTALNTPNANPNKTFLFNVEQNYATGGTFPPCDGCPIPKLTPSQTTPVFDAIIFEDITVLRAPKGLPLGTWDCGVAPCTGIVFSNITLVDASGPIALLCSGVHGPAAVNVDPALSHCIDAT
tara:strand:- start:1 stop:1335 length:1335 start_codon:yes stop_codon:yes gene_type:complete